MTNRTVLVLAGPEYEDLELWYPKLRLEEAGFKAHLMSHGAPERTMTRVLVGPEQNADDARALITLLGEGVGVKGHLLNLLVPGE